MTPRNPRLNAIRLLEIARETVPGLSPFGLRNRPEEFSDIDLLSIARCAVWLDLQVPSQRVNLDHTSYGYKHMVERWIQSYGSHEHIGNGSFIAAAIGLGFHGVVVSPTSPNMYINILESPLQQTVGFRDVEPLRESQRA